LESREHSSDDLEAAYSAWMTALLRAIGGGKADVHELLSPLLDDGSPFKKEKAAKSTVRQWFNRGTLPNNSKGRVVDALCEIMAKHVPEAPPGAVPGLSFFETLEALRKARESNQKAGRKFADATEGLYLNGALRFRPIPIKNLDELELNLGSSIFDGALPPYCRREVDAELLAALEDDTQKIVVLVGPPKAGKTRSLLEALKKSKHAPLDILWLDASTKDSIEQVANHVLGKDANNAVVMLDDLQSFKLSNEATFNLAVLNSLKKARKIVATLHSANAHAWSQVNVTNDFDSVESFLSASHGVRKAFLEKTIVLESNLSDEELDSAKLTLLGSNPNSLGRLGEYFSATEVLQERAKKILTGNDVYELAFLNALIAAKIIWPGGIDIDEIKALVRNEIESNTNSPWVEEYWLNLLKSFTRGLTAKSPHALMMRVAGDRRVYSIFDGVWQTVRPEKFEITYSAPPLVFTIDEIISIADSGYVQQALTILEQLKTDEQYYKFGWLGILNGELENYDLAEKFYHQALEHAKNESEMTVIFPKLAWTYLSKGDLDNAQAYFLKSKNVGHIARFYFHNGNFAEAENWLRKAMVSGDLEAGGLLGIALKRMNRDDEAIPFLEDALLRGSGPESVWLHKIYLDKKDVEKAIWVSKKAISLGIQKHFIILGRLQMQLGDYGGAEENFVRAVNSPSKTDAYRHLALLYGQMGLAEESERYSELFINATKND